ncbi:MAG: response regulator [Verrucomicrobia bacterium]|nr:response regulator [Verrucomicrobiota bacterium]
MTLNNKRILLADDDPHDVKMTLAALTKDEFPHEVVVAEDGTEVLDYLHCRGKFRTRPTGHPLIILLDLKMPKVDGLEVLQQIKSDASLRMIPVIVFTSSRVASDVLKCYESGANAYVVKPTDFRQFISAINSIKTFWTTTNELPSDPLRADEAKPSEIVAGHGIAKAAA